MFDSSPSLAPFLLTPSYDETIFSSRSRATSKVAVTDTITIKFLNYGNLHEP